MTHFVLNLIIAGIFLAAIWFVAVYRRPSYRKIDRLERQLGMRPSYDLSPRTRRRSR